MQTIKIKYSKQRLVRDINKLKPKVKTKENVLPSFIQESKVKISQAERYMRANYSYNYELHQSYNKREPELERNPSRKPTFDKAERPDRMK